MTPDRAGAGLTEAQRPADWSAFVRHIEERDAAVRERDELLAEVKRLRQRLAEVTREEV